MTGFPRVFFQLKAETGMANFHLRKNRFPISLVFRQVYPDVAESSVSDAVGSRELVMSPMQGGAVNSISYSLVNRFRHLAMMRL
jgi:hypothetical protein